MCVCVCIYIYMSCDNISEIYTLSIIREIIVHILWKMKTLRLP